MPHRLALKTEFPKVPGVYGVPSAIPVSANTEMLSAAELRNASKLYSNSSAFNAHLQEARKQRVFSNRCPPIQPAAQFSRMNHLALCRPRYTAFIMSQLTFSLLENRDLLVLISPNPHSQSYPQLAGGILVWSVKCWSDVKMHCSSSPNFSKMDFSWQPHPTLTVSTYLPKHQVCKDISSSLRRKQASHKANPITIVTTLLHFYHNKYMGVSDTHKKNH